MSGTSAVEDAPPPSVTFASGGLSWTRVRTPRLLSRIAKAFYVVGMLGMLGMTLGLSVAGFGSLLILLAGPLLILSYILSLTQTSFPGGLEVSSDELVIQTGDKRRSIPRTQITGALVVDREVFGSFVPTVEIELAGGDTLTARLPDPRSAHAVVRRLGFGAGGKRVHAALSKPTRRLLHPLIATISYVVATMMVLPLGWIGNADDVIVYGYALTPLLTLAIYSLAKRLVRAPELTVGDDGVLVRGRFKSEYIPRTEIARVSAPANGPFIIEKRNGESLYVNALLVDFARRSAIARVIDERAGPSAAAADRFAHYDRAGRALPAWREHLSQAMNQASYRENAATVEEADAVLHSPQATPEQRVGAALALRVAGQPTARIRVAVEGAVDERVREALDAVAAEAEDDVVLEKALRRLVG
jgi:hypothetical protein